MRGLNTDTLFTGSVRNKMKKKANESAEAKESASRWRSYRCYLSQTAAGTMLLMLMLLLITLCHVIALIVNRCYRYKMLFNFYFSKITF